MNNLQQPIVVSSGEPAGIGPDCIVQLAARQPQLSFVVMGDEYLLASRAQQLGLKFVYYKYQANQVWPPSLPGVYVQHIPVLTRVSCGQPDIANAEYVLECIRQAVMACSQRQFHAMVTAPVHKGIINDAGIAFSGHTEWIAQLLQVKHDPVMLLVANQLRVALATIHLPLAAVPAAITAERLVNCITVLAKDLRQRFAIKHPRISVCGLNPHAGEGGYLGREEIDIIIPVLQSLRTQNYELLGPVSADTAFLPDHLHQVDAILTMYHDQGLPVIKTLAFMDAVNVTLGLPIIRTSVDHGTAFSLAGTGQAQCDSLFAAIQLAQQLA